MKFTCLETGLEDLAVRKEVMYRSGRTTKVIHVRIDSTAPGLDYLGVKITPAKAKQLAKVLLKAAK